MILKVRGMVSVGALSARILRAPLYSAFSAGMASRHFWASAWPASACSDGGSTRSSWAKAVDEIRSIKAVSGEARRGTALFFLFILILLILLILLISVGRVGV